MKPHIPRSLILLLLLMMTTSSAKAEVWSLLHSELRDIVRQRDSIRGQLAVLPPLPPPQAHEHAGFHSGFASTTDAVRWVQVDLGREVPMDAVVVVPAYFGATSEGAGPYGWPVRFRMDASRDAEFAESLTILDATRTDQPAR
ncbi:MAG TPA: hypothetical protein VLE43_13130, partial [Candidatus Saccharimonadia bacterium]|nr:hypothetical protein [Candidatus Saccharimonadia bacterium]